jgi:hypothetical protein
MSSRKTEPKKSFRLSASRSQARDTGLALALVCCIAFLVTRNPRLVLAAMVVLLVTMTVPSLLGPAAKLWFGLSHILGTIMSKVMLTLVFSLVLTPMGLLRRLAGKDSMRLRCFGRDQTSVFRVRDHEFTPADIEQPF